MITRHNPKPRLSDSVNYGEMIFLSGQVPQDLSGDIISQTEEVIGKIDAILAKSGSDKSRLLSVQIWLKNINRDFAGFNEVWEKWLPAELSPARATIEANMAKENCLIEIMVTAVKK